MPSSAAGSAELSRFETVPKSEPEQVDSLIRLLREQMEKDYPPRKTKRDAHPKHHGLLEAEFVVEPNLDSSLRVGLFREPRTYRAFIRSSSASGKIQPDGVADLRGFAIKVTGVDGAPASPDGEPAAQDFVLLSYSFMPLGTVALFHDAIYHSIKTHRLLFALKMIATGRGRILHQLEDARRHATSPLDIRYWSTTPYLFGADRVAKYSVVPTSAHKSELPSPLGDTYLRDNMARHLSEHEATFDFKLQLRSDPATFHVEDSAIEWKESETPFVKVATLRIPRQTFATTERDEMAETLRFTPGHALADHRGIGGLNRARTRIYRELSRFRNERNGVAR